MGSLVQQVLAGASRIGPATATARPAQVHFDSGVVAAISNPSTTVLAKGVAIGVGYVEDSSSWSEVGSEPPEGTYAICRSSDRAVQLVTDAVASRTLWYYWDNVIFVASTSQRWIATVIGSFQTNHSALPWMLTTGTLGPTDAWDRRVNRLQADSVLTLDRGAWSLDIKSRHARFNPYKASASEQKEKFVSQLRKSFDTLHFDYSKWVLPLSGGYDSRAILCMLRRTEGLRTITWGTRASLDDVASDAAIATRLARSMGVSHEYFETDSTAGSLAQIFEDFVAYTEGRIDRIGGYLDGFAIWQTLLDRGVEGIIRGDEGFGWRDVRTFVDARKSVGLLLWSDFGGLPDLRSLDWNTQELPDFLVRDELESPSEWRDRLYHQYRIPTILAALTDPKTSYVEVVNPLLAHSIIRSIRTLPDHMRTEKKLFKEVVNDLGTNVPYANVASIANQKVVLRSSEAVTILSRALTSTAARDVFPESIIAFILEGIQEGRNAAHPKISKSFRRRVRNLIPHHLTRKFKPPERRSSIDFYSMAFRAYIAVRSHQLLREDASTCPRSAAQPTI
jgi:hypothetical protein